jgi:acyl-CoA thioester hydrolase
MMVTGLETSEPSRCPLEVGLRFRPKPYEIDLMGVVGNAVVVRWMEDLRVSMMDRYFPEVDVTRPEHQSVIYRTEIHYKRPVRYCDRVDGRAWLSAASRLKWNVRFEFRLEATSRIALEATQWGAFVRSQGGRLVPAGNQLLDRLRQHKS